MSRSEIGGVFPLPKIEYEHVPARELSHAEARTRQRTISVDTKTIHGEILAKLPDTAVRLFIYANAFGDEDAAEPEVADYFTPEECEIIENGRTRMAKILSRYRDEQDMATILDSCFSTLHKSDLFAYQRVDTDLPAIGKPGKFSYDQAVSIRRSPTAKEYLTIVHGMARRAEYEARQVRTRAPGLMLRTKKYLHTNGYLSNKDFDLRAKEIDVTVVDPITMLLDRSSGNARGLYNYGKIILNAGIGRSDDGTFVHELLHQLGGIKRLRLTYHGTREEQVRSLMGEIASLPRIHTRVQRSGLRITRIGGIELFGWLDEAVTSEMTEEIMGEPDPLDPWSRKGGPSYHEEITIKEYARKLGGFVISKDLERKAYFEDNDPGLQNRIPHWRALMHSYNAAYGQGFLLLLNSVMTKAFAGDLRAFESAEELIRSRGQKLPVAKSDV